MKVLIFTLLRADGVIDRVDVIPDALPVGSVVSALMPALFNVFNIVEEVAVLSSGLFGRW